MWLDLLQKKADDTSITSVGLELGLSRTTISLVLAGKYPANTDKIAQRVLDTYGRITCPHLNEEITLSACRQHHTAAVPTSSPRAMKHWRACQSCPNNKGGQDAND